VKPCHCNPDLTSVQRAVTILADNSTRLAEFRTQTAVAEEPGRRVVYKRALTQEAASFLRTIVEREAASRDYLDGQFCVLCGELADDRIEYGYLPYRSLREVIAEDLRHKRWDAANAVFNTYIHKLKALPAKRVVPLEFLRTIARGAGDGTIAVDCLCRGVIDLVPRNILIDGDRWIVLDNEWSFDFPIPLQFVLFRALLETSMALAPEICGAAAESFPISDVFIAGFNKRYYVPVDWLQYLEQDGTRLSEMMEWEMGFQRYVRGPRHTGLWRINKHPTVMDRCLPPRVRSPGRLAAIVKSLPIVRPSIQAVRRMCICVYDWGRAQR